MAENEIDWTYIKTVNDFESLVTTLIFLSDLLHIDSIKSVAKEDLYWKTREDLNGKQFVYRILFKNPFQDNKKQEIAYQRYFEEKVKPILENENKSAVHLYINFNDFPSTWSTYSNLKIIKATDIGTTIQDIWWPIFHKHFTGGMHPTDAKECEFLNPFTESLIPAIKDLSIKEILNVISWLKLIAFYRPKEILDFCQTLYSDKRKETEIIKHPFFGSVTLSRNDYLKELRDILEPIAAHPDQFDSALELLLRISTDLKEDFSPFRGYLSQSVEKITGYYYGRDFLVKDKLFIYKPDFNQKTLDVVERLIKNERDNELLYRCIAVLPNLLKMKIDTTEWIDNSKVTWREYRLPLADKNLKDVRKRALNLLLSTFNESNDMDIRHRCLIELRDAFYYWSLTADFQDELMDILSFLGYNIEDNDPFVSNQILEMLELFTRSSLDKISSEALLLQTKLQDKYEIKLYHLLFGRKGFDPNNDEINDLVKQTFEHYSVLPEQLLVLIDVFHKSSKTHPSGLRSFLQYLGYQKPEFALNIIKYVSENQSFQSKLSISFTWSLGYLLCGIKLKDESLWQSCIKLLQTNPNKFSTIIILTGFQIHNFDRFTASDLKIIEDLITGADEKIKIHIAETLWYFDKYSDFKALLKLYKNLSDNMTEKLADSILKGLAQGEREEESDKKWDIKENINILKEILFSMTDFSRLEWDAMSGYYLELLLRVLLKNSIDDLLEFFKRRIDPEKIKNNEYNPLPYNLEILFQDISDEKQNDLVTRILEWDSEKYSIYWLARLIGLVCSKKVQPLTLITLQKMIEQSDTNKLLLIASLLDQIPLGNDFYELAMQIVQKGFDQQTVMNQLYSSFISKTGGGRTYGEPFPSHTHHKELITEFREKYKSSEEVQKFLIKWEAEIDDMIRRDEEEDIDR